jgi:hypothetical protein
MSTYYTVIRVTPEQLKKIKKVTARARALAVLQYGRESDQLTVGDPIGSRPFNQNIQVFSEEEQEQVKAITPAGRGLAMVKYAAGLERQAETDREKFGQTPGVRPDPEYERYMVNVGGGRWGVRGTHGRDMKVLTYGRKSWAKYTAKQAWPNHKPKYASGQVVWMTTSDTKRTREKVTVNHDVSHICLRAEVTDREGKTLLVLTRNLGGVIHDIKEI